MSHVTKNLRMFRVILSILGSTLCGRELKKRIPTVFDIISFMSVFSWYVVPLALGLAETVEYGVAKVISHVN